jgi:hypothetical protein
MLAQRSNMFIQTNQKILLPDSSCGMPQSESYEPFVNNFIRLHRFADTMSQQSDF